MIYQETVLKQKAYEIVIDKFLKLRNNFTINSFQYSNNITIYRLISDDIIKIESTIVTKDQNVIKAQLILYFEYDYNISNSKSIRNFAFLDRLGNP